MSEVKILLNPASPVHAELQAGIRETLGALETATYTETRQPAPPGTLSVGWDQVIGFAVQHPDKAANVAAALLNAISNLLRWSSKRRGDTEKGERGAEKGTATEKPIIIVVDDKQLALPASEGAKKKFIKQLGDDSERTSEDLSKGRLSPRLGAKSRASSRFKQRNHRRSTRKK